MVRFCLLVLVPFAAGASCATLRFKAAIRSITGGGALTVRVASGAEPTAVGCPEANCALETNSTITTGETLFLNLQRLSQAR